MNIDNLEILKLLIANSRTGYTLEKIKHLERKRRKKRAIGLFFGSFNPIHLGHIQLAEYIYQQSYFDELWYVVSPRNPLKEQAGLIDEQHRKAMIELATTDKDYRILPIIFSF